MNTTPKHKARVTHTSCDECGSSDAKAVYPDGTHCFSCGHNTRIKNTPNNQSDDVDDEERYDHTMQEQERNQKTINAVYADITDRGILMSTCKTFGVKVIKNASGLITGHIYPYTDATGTEVLKLRDVRVKEFRWKTKPNDVQFFGQKLFPNGGRALTICEGELDAMAAYQMNGGFPCVSVGDGAQSTIKYVRKNIEWLSKFQTIVLCLDNDAPGKEAAAKAAEFLSQATESIVKICTLPELPMAGDKVTKDPCDYLKAGKSREYNDAWFRSQEWTPDNIVISSQLKDSLKTQQHEMATPYPWDALNLKTFGIRKKEIVLFCARRGVGKSASLKQIITHILEQDKQAKIGTFFLEETPVETALGILGMFIDKPLHLPDKRPSDAQLDALFETYLSDGRLGLYDSHGENDWDKIKARIRYYVKVMGCDYIIIDHLGMLVLNSRDERQELDRIGKDLRNLAVELNCAFLCAMHLNREGHSRGSDGPENFANIVLYLDREVAAENEQDRLKTAVKVTKNRYYGAGTGYTMDLVGNPARMQMKQVTQKQFKETKALINDDDINGL